MESSPVRYFYCYYLFLFVFCVISSYFLEQTLFAFEVSLYYQLLGPSNCKKRLDTLNEQPNLSEVQKLFIKPYQATFDYINNHSGFGIVHPHDALEFYFIVSTESEMNLTLPEWTKNIYPEPLTSISSQVYGYWNYDEAVRKINTGYFLKKIIDDSFSKMNDSLKPKTRKMFLYSGHESTLGYSLDALNLLNHSHIPPYGSAILFELRKDNESQYYIQIRYENDLDKSPTTLHIPGCGTLCPINTFIEAYDHLIPKIDLKEACLRE